MLRIDIRLNYNIKLQIRFEAIKQMGTDVLEI